ncbi:MAG: SAM-dependent methyltransferase [Actinomycetota bacterium]|nr:SAM-dependent methyltransferase [Actinomycetota bacterium]
MSFADFMETALYDQQGGFFATGGAAGRRGHFLTSPEVGPLFGAILARALDRWWAELGRPEPYVVVEAGAGTGTLAAGVRAALPACAPALHYVMVERSEPLRGRQAAVVPLARPSDPPHDARPIFTSLAELPGQPFAGIVVANELLDNLPVHLLERRGGWDEVRVGELHGQLVEVLVPAPPALVADAELFAPDASAGARVPLQVAARSWLQQALSLVERGRVVVIDYADTTASLAARPAAEWLRTYRAHGRGGHPLEHPGAQDITCEVAVDQLARVRPPAVDRAQAEFLQAHGIEELTAAARARWHERAHLGDLEALEARSRVGEAAALTDPAGLGAFRVLEWAVH